MIYNKNPLFGGFFIFIDIFIGYDNMINVNVKEDLKKYIKQKPKDLVIDDLKWKYLVRGVLRSKNILIVGPTGCGKTMSAQSVAKSLNRYDKFYYFNLGSTQDARSVLIGNTHFNKNTGTVFNESTFVRAIRTEDSVILLDEISRAHPDAWNILMTVLDDLQRYLRLDEKENCEVVNVAKGVTFIATANIGNEYTATRVMDKALLNRFPVKIEMAPLERNEEFNLLKNKYDIVSDSEEFKLLESLVDIAEHTRLNYKRDDSKISSFISTRTVVEMTELIKDGFNLLEIAESVIYPDFDEDGGTDSERTYMKQLVQKYVIDENEPNLFGNNDPDNNDPPF